MYTSQAYASNINCELFDRDLIDVDTLRGFNPAPGGRGVPSDPDAMYDPDQPLDLPGTC